MTDPSGKMRLFFAYWPGPAQVTKLNEWVTNAHALFGGRKMRLETLHMTLAFLGACEANRANALAAACADWVLPTGPMILSQPGRFSGVKVLWVGPEQPEALSLAWLFRAHRELWEKLAPFGWAPSESQYRPHVSLLRNAGPGDLAPLKGPAVAWTPERCVLVASRPTDAGSRYEVLADISLAGG